MDFHQTNLLSKIALSSDGRTVASVDDAGTIILWNVTKQLPAHSLAPPGPKYQQRIPSIDISPDSKTLAAGGCSKLRDDGTCEQGQIVLWDIETGKPIGLPLLGYPDSGGIAAFSDVAFSPDGQTLVSSSQAGILLWNIPTRTPSPQALTLPAEKDFIDYSDYYDHLLFSPDGKILASYSVTGFPFSFVLWDLMERKPLAHAFHFPDTATQASIAFSPNGQQLASIVVDASDKDIITLWDITPKVWQERACSIVNRNLTKEEWTEFISDEPYNKVCLNLPLLPDLSSA